MATVLDLRGTHGSGKSHLVHSLLNTFGKEPLYQLIDGKEVHQGYFLPKIDSVVIGKYETSCGGCDGIKTPDEVVRRIRMYATNPLFRFVILEGILVAHTFKRYSDLAEELVDYKFLFLDTPLETCIERVVARRLAIGNSRPFDPRNVRHDHKQIWTNVQAKCHDAGRTVVVLNHKHAWRQMQKILGVSVEQADTVNQ